MSTTFARAAARLVVIPLATSVFLATPAPASHAETRVGTVSCLTVEVPAPTQV